MSMRKRLSALVLTGMVAAPALTANAATNTNVQMIPQGGEGTQQVDMHIGVTANNSSAIQGQLTIEMPTELSFVVDKDGKVPVSTLKVKNSSQAGSGAVQVYVDSLEEENANGGVTLLNSAPVAGQHKRNDIYLTLRGNEQEINLGSIVNQPSSDAPDRLVATVAANSEQDLRLAGKAGTDPLAGNEANTGLTEKFKMIFRLKA